MFELEGHASLKLETCFVLCQLLFKILSEIRINEPIQPLDCFLGVFTVLFIECSFFMYFPNGEFPNVQFHKRQLPKG